MSNTGRSTRARAPMADRLPYKFSLQQHKLEEGFCSIRVSGFDFGPKRLVCSVIEINASPRLGGQLAAKAQKLASAIAKKAASNISEVNSDDFMEEVVTDVVGDDGEAVDSSWLQDVHHMAECVHILAIYQINCTDGTLVYWVHPRIKKSEVEPMTALHAKWREQAARDVSQLAQTTLREELARDSPVPESNNNTDNKESRFYLSVSVLADAFPKVKVDTPDNTAGHFSSLIHSLVTIMSNPLFAPLFTQQCPALMEPQVDQLLDKQRGYICKTERDPKLLVACFEAVKRAPSPEVGLELIRLYEQHVGLHQRHPINWALSLCTMAVIRALDVMHGYTSRRLVLFHARKFRIASVLAEQNPEYFNDSTLADSRRYKLRKEAPVKVITSLIEKQLSSDPAMYDLLQFIGRTGGAGLDKKDDAADACGIPLDWAFEFLRARPYNRLDKEKIEEAAALWSVSMNVDCSEFKYYKELHDKPPSYFSQSANKPGRKKAATATTEKKPSAKKSAPKKTKVQSKLTDMRKNPFMDSDGDDTIPTIAPLYTRAKPAPKHATKKSSKKRPLSADEEIAAIEEMVNPTQIDGVQLASLSRDHDADDEYKPSQKRRKMASIVQRDASGESDGEWTETAGSAHLMVQQELSFVSHDTEARTVHRGGSKKDFSEKSGRPNRSAELVDLYGEIGGGGDEDDELLNPIGSIIAD